MFSNKLKDPLCYMFGSKHNIDPRFHKDPRGVFDKLHLLDRIIDRNEAMLHSSGSPMTLWKYFPFGPSCTCSIANELDKRCPICYGTGYLNGYQKYGYMTYTYGSSSIGREDKYGVTLENTQVVEVPGSTNTAFILKSGTSGYVETQWIDIVNAYEHSFLRAKVFTPAKTEINYMLIFDELNSMIVHDLSVPITIPVQFQQMKIRVILSRTSIHVPSPALNIFKYRKQIKAPFTTYISNREKQTNILFNSTTPSVRDNRFDINIPSFLASKQVAQRVITRSQEGAVVKLEPKFWALPDVKIDERDIGMFLSGNNTGKRFEFQNIEIIQHGEKQRVMHSSWNSRFIMDEQDVLGIVYSLD